jgi:hypothetical protein
LFSFQLPSTLNLCFWKQLKDWFFVP